MPDHKRSIVVPKDLEAMQALDFDEAADEQLVSWDLSDADFTVLWQSGVFSILNSELSCLIDDYEDEQIIDGTQIETASRIVEELQRSASTEAVSGLARLHTLCLEGQRRNTGVFFFF